jgi:hypothetical protein
MTWRQNPTRIAWLIMSASFLACCVLAVAVPVGIRSYLLHASRSLPASATATAGTAQLWTPGANEPTAVTDRREVVEGSRVVTDASAKALLTLLAGKQGADAVATIQLSSDTAIALERARSPRFDLSGDPRQVHLDVRRGRVFVTAQDVGGREGALVLLTPQARLELDNGTFDVIVDGDTTLARVRSGLARITAEGRMVEAVSGQRVTAQAGQPPEPPETDTLNLVLNGSFDAPLEPSWTVFAEVKPGASAGEVSVEQERPGNAVRFMRRTEDGVPNRVGILQTVDRDVQGYDALNLRLDVKIMYQSVPGGGEKATEYPLMADVSYTDVYGKDLHWYQGFYYLDLPPGSPYLPPTGEKVPLGVWYTFESPNLFDLLSETQPARINSISVYANGHDYESLATNIALTVR